MTSPVDGFLMKPSYKADMFAFLFETLLNSLVFLIRPPKRPNRFQRAIAHQINHGSIWKRLGVGLLISLGAAIVSVGFLFGLLAGIVAIGKAIDG